MGVVFAKQAEIGKEYIDEKGKSHVRLVVKEKTPNEVRVSFNVPGYGYKPLSLKPDHLLRELAPSEIKEQLGKSVTKGGRIIVKVNKAAKVQRLEKVDKGERTPRVKLEGYDLRKDYRCRLSAARVADCEAARRPNCSCRCGGALHGISHKPWLAAEDALFKASPTSSITAEQVLALIKKFAKK